MRILEFEVDKQRIRKKPTCDFSSIVAGTEGYLKAKFHFVGLDWTGCKKAASFWIDGMEHAELLDKDNTCFIPKEALVGEQFLVSLMGKRGSTYTIQTGKTKVKQEVN